MAIVGDQSERTRHASLDLVLVYEFNCNGELVFLIQLLSELDIFKTPATKGTVDYVKVEITSGEEILYEWQDKLRKDNCFATLYRVKR